MYSFRVGNRKLLFRKTKIFNYHNFHWYRWPDSVKHTWFILTLKFYTSVHIPIPQKAMVLETNPNLSFSIVARKNLNNEMHVAVVPLGFSNMILIMIMMIMIILIMTKVLIMMVMIMIMIMIMIIIMIILTTTRTIIIQLHSANCNIVRNHRAQKHL